MRIILANPRGFCAGVDRAIAIVERVLALFGQPVYVHHEVVHNKTVVEQLKQQGVVFVENLLEIPSGAVTVFSAHGVSQDIKKLAKKRSLRVFDATCPLVAKVHMEVARYSRLGQECILIGHIGHPEVEGTLGHYDNPEGGIYLIENINDIDSLNIKNPNSLTYVTQTTLSVCETQTIIEFLKKKFPKIVSPKKEDICYATQNRQKAVRALARQCDVILVLGSVNSSNSNRLKELVEQLDKPAYLIDSAENIVPEWFLGKFSIGITAGASAPEILVQNVIKYLKCIKGDQLCSVLELNGDKEDISFPLPLALREKISRD